MQGFPDGVHHVVADGIHPSEAVLVNALLSLLKVQAVFRGQFLAHLYVVSKLLGHSSIQMTEVYAKIVDQKKVETMNLVNNLFTNPAATPAPQTANAI